MVKAPLCDECGVAPAAHWKPPACAGYRPPDLSPAMQRIYDLGTFIGIGIGWALYRHPDEKPPLLLRATRALRNKKARLA